MKKVTLIFLVMFIFLGYILPYDKQYLSNKYHVAFKYPGTFSENPNYINRFEGKEGFVQFDALQGVESLEKVSSYEAFSEAKPYGESPKIEKVLIDGKEAILIIPSSDQNPAMKDQAALIVKYSKAININNQSFNYFILWADKNHIKKIIATLHFI
jgi:TolB protein